MYTLSLAFLPVMRTLAALITTTKSPASRCGENVGFVLPRRTPATRDARRPSTCPSALVTYQRRAARAASVLRFFVLRVMAMIDSHPQAKGPTAHCRCRGPSQNGGADETRTRDLRRDRPAF